MQSLKNLILLAETPGTVYTPACIPDLNLTSTSESSMDICALSGLLNGIAATVRVLVLSVRIPRLPRRHPDGPSCLSLSVWDDFYCVQPEAITSVNRTGRA